MAWESCVISKSIVIGDFSFLFFTVEPLLVTSSNDKKKTLSNVHSIGLRAGMTTWPLNARCDHTQELFVDCLKN